MAKELVLNPNYSISQVSYELGSNTRRISPACSRKLWDVLLTNTATNILFDIYLIA